MMKIKTLISKYGVNLICLLFIPLLYHFLYSQYGFSLADDGYVLAQSRRILDGQVPHKDFIWVRPVLSAFIHCPLVLLGGDYVFWISRFIVWLQYAFTTWVWIKVVEVFLNKKFSFKESIYYFLLAFVFNVNNNWLVINQTLDAVFLTSTGIYFIIKKQNFSRFLGYFFVGSAVLTRQNFLLVGILVIFIFKDSKNLKCWFSLILPVVLSAAYLYINNALGDAIMQIGAQSKIFPYWPKFGYFSVYTLLGICLSILIVFLSKLQAKMFMYIKILFCFIGFFILMFKLAVNSYNDASFLVFAFVFVFVVFCRNLELKKISFLVLFISWSASIAYGMPYPIYLSGTILFLGAMYFHYVLNIVLSEKIILTTLFLVLVVFSYVRYQYNYKDLASNELKYKINDYLKGTKFIYTSENTFLLIKDLNEAIYKCGLSTYFVLEWFQGIWVKSTQKNLLNCDLPVNTELPINVLVDKVIDKLLINRKENFIIVPKVGSIMSAKWLVRLSMKEYPYGPIGTNLAYYYSEVTRYIIKNFNKVDETKYFFIYQ